MKCDVVNMRRHTIRGATLVLKRIEAMSWYHRLVSLLEEL